MPIFKYKARDPSGKTIKGEIEAADRNAVVNKLRAMGYFIASVAEEVPKTSVEALNIDIGDLLTRVTPRDLVVFNNQLATMISSGLTLTSSLSILTQQIENKKLKHIVAEIGDAVEGGSSFSAALEKHPHVFSPLFVNMIRAGETGGALDEILKRLSMFAEQTEEITSNIKTALTYPTIIVSLAIVVVILLVIKVFPVFESLFESLNLDLPLPTQILLFISRIIRGYLIGIIVVAVISIVGLIKYYKTKAGKLMIDNLLLRLPVAGDLIKKIAISRFTRTLSTLISSGVPIMQSLRIVQATVGNAVAANVVGDIIIYVNRGESMAEPLRQTKVFPPMVGHMVAVGEETGTLDTILGKIADFYDREVSVTIQRLSAAIEPFLILFVGIIVGMTALALFLPMFDMIKGFT
ncbi:MAG: type II secretion system F family protein [Candidatus Omnitrophota bacterium]